MLPFVRTESMASVAWNARGRSSAAVADPQSAVADPQSAVADPQSAVADPGSVASPLAAGEDSTRAGGPGLDDPIG